MTNSTEILDNVCEFIVDCLHATAPTEEEGYPLIRTPNIGRGRLDLDDVYRVSEDTYERWTRRAVPRVDDLVLAREAPAGNVAIIRNGQQVCLGQRTVLLRPIASRVDPYFLCYFLLAPAQQGALLSGETGATSKHVNMADIRRLPLEGLPPLATQRRVGRMIAAYDELIEGNRRRIQLLEQAARLTHEEWFVRHRFPGHENVVTVDGVPEDWEVKTLGDIAVTNQETYRAEGLPGKISYVDISSVAKGRITDKATMSSGDAPGRARRRVRSGDVIWSNVRPNLRSFALVLDPGKNDVVSTGFTVLTAVDVPFSYLYLLVTTEEFVRHLDNHATGASYPAVRPGDFERAQVICPAMSVLELFHKSVGPMFWFSSILEREARCLEEARDLLLPCLMNGKIAA